MMFRIQPLSTIVLWILFTIIGYLALCITPAAPLLFFIIIESVAVHDVWARIFAVIREYTLAGDAAHAYALAFSALLSINVILLYKLVRSRTGIFRSASVGVWGIVLGSFGVGCAACGTLLLAPLASGAIIGSVLLMLPLNGMEIGIVGLVVLTGSAYAAYSALQKTTC